MADSNVFSGFAEGANQGANWAAKQTELDLSRQQVEQSKAAHDEQKRQFDATLGKQALNDFHSLATMAPGKVKKGAIERTREYYEKSGIVVDPSIYDAVDDPNYIPQFDKYFQAMNGGVAQVNPKMYNEAMSQLVPALGSKNVLELVTKGAENATQMRKVAAEAAMKQKAEEEKTLARKKSQDTRDSRIVNSIFTDKNNQQEVRKINSATGARALLDQIKSGHITDSTSIRNQLGALMSSIEMGGPGAVADRQAMGVQTLYTKLQDARSYLESKPNSTIPKAYLDQISAEADALGDRAIKNYKIGTDAAIAGLIGGDNPEDPDALPSNAHKFAKARQSTFLREHGYHPETLERLDAVKQAEPKAAEADKKVKSQRDAKLERLKSIYNGTPQGAARDKIQASQSFQALSPADKAYITGAQ